MRAIPVIFSFARSGGTLVNQLLGVHHQCLVLSEVNPAASYKPIIEQAVEWLGLVSSHESVAFSRLSYSQLIKSLYARASERGKLLIIRDWVTTNYLPGCAGDNIAPSCQLEQDLYMKHAGFAILPLVITRRSAEVYKSIKHNFMHLQRLEIETFAESYLKYAQAVSRMPLVHMEDLRNHPDATLIKILQQFNLDSDDYKSLIRKFHVFKNCTGNTTLPISSESSLAQVILPSVQDIAVSGMPPALYEADRLLHYD